MGNIDEFHQFKSINTKVKVVNELTKEALASLGAENTPINVKTVLSEFWKGE